MKKLITPFILMVCITVGYSQASPEKCHFDHKLDEKLAESSENIDSFNSMNEKIDQIVASNKLYKGPLDVYTIPVVVHVIHKGEAVGTGSNISDAQINSAIDNLTDTYRNIFGTSIDNLIEFQLAIRDENCNVTDGIVRVDGSGVPGYTANGVSAGGPGADENTLKDLSKWNTDQYMNFWIVSEIDGNNGGAGIQGWANLPFPGYDPYDGSVMMASSFGYDPTNAQPTFNLNFGRDNSTPIHEVGHFLSLYHTFQGDNNGTICPANVTTGTDSDGCNDTDPHIRNNSTCPANGTNNPCTGGNMNEIKLNYMDYASCPVKFTLDQKDRMRATLEDPSLRGGLVTSLALTPITIPFVSPIAASCTPTTQADGLGSFFAGIETTSFKEINSSTGYATASQDNGYVAPSCSGVAFVELNEVVPLSVSVLGSNTSNLKVYIDYNNDGDFNDPGELVHTANSMGGGATTTANITIPALGDAVLNTHLRMRVIHDLNAIPNACHNPQYSQAEDFSVYITDPVAATPVADFSVDDVTPCVNQEITFDDLSTNTPTTWAWVITPAAGWSYIGGTSAASENPQVTFTTAGNYDIQLTATNASGTDDEIKNTYITVHASPTLTLTPTNTTCGLDNGQIVAVVSGNTGAPTYSWASGSATDTQTGLAVGNETLVVTVDGCIINDDDDIAADASPTVTLAPTQPTCGLNNGQIVATVSGNTGVPTYTWASGSTTDTQTGLGAGNETLVVTVDGCTLNEDETLTAVTTPTLTLTPTQPTCGLNNGQIVATVSGNTGAPTYAWNSGSITDTQTGLGAGNETLVVTVDGCTINENETLTAVATPTVALTPTNATCGLNNGQIVAVVSGNTGAPTYTWNSGSTTDTQTGLGAGNETLIVTVDGCTINDNETLTATASPTVALTPTNTTCGLDNGQVVAVVSGNTGAPTYTWASGSTADTQTGLAVGNETLVVTVDGCTINDNDNIAADAAPTVTLASTQPTCGLNNGQIVATVSGNTGAPTYTWASGSATDTQTGLGAGNETLIVTVDGCTINDDETLIAGAAPTVTLASTPPTCGLNNGQIVATVSGNTGAPTYAWNSGSITDTQSGLGAGNETLVVTVDGCTINNDETLTAIAIPTVTLTPTNATCGLNNGQIVAVVSGNTGAPTYTWNSGSTSDTQTGLGAGNETLVVIVDGCTINEDETLTISAAPTVNLTPTNATCGINNGQIVAVVSGNTGAPTYAWNSGSTSDTQTGLGAGNETLIVTVDGCTINDNETLTISASPTVAFTTTNTTCGLDNGQIVAVVSGNTGAPTYTWASGSNTDTQTGLGAGNETLVVTVDGCTINGDDDIAADASPTVNLATTQPSCGLNNGQIVATVVGNIGIPTYGWASGSNTDTQTGLGAGNETLVVTVDGCTINENETLTAIPSPTVSLTSTQPSCGLNNGQIVASINGNTGAPTYTWASGSTTDTQTGLSPGNETLVVTVDGCTINDDETLTAVAIPTVTLTPTNATCGLNNGQIVASVSGNTGVPAYTWASGSPTDTQTGLGAGNETLIITVDGCTINDNQSLTASNAPTVNLTPTNTSCGLDNGQIVAVVSGNTGAPAYTWASGSTTDTQTGLAVGNETLVVTVDGCTINDNDNIAADVTPTLTLAPTQPSCGLNNGQIIATVAGNIGAPAYTWASGSTTNTQTGLGAGNEALVVNVDGCTINEDETLIAIPSPTVSLTPTQPTCGLNNGQIVASINGNTGAPTYTWASGSNTDTQTGLGAGNETLIVTVDGCTINENETLTAVAIPTVSLTPTNATCGLNNGQIVATVSGNNGAPTYTWASGSTTDTQTGLGAGNETLVVIVDGCTINDNETLTASAAPTVTLTPTNSTCGLDNGQIVATISGNTGTPTYAWGSGSTSATQNGLGAGNEVLIVNVDGCTINESETLTTTPGSDAGIVGGPATICSNTSPGIINSLNYSGEIINWIYSTDQINWTELDSLNDSFTANTITETTWFGFIVQLNTCPSDTSFIEVSTLSLPDVDAGIDQTIDQGNSTLIEGTTSETNFIWTPNENIIDNLLLSTTITPDSSTHYTLTVTDVNGCINSDSLEITVLTDWDYMTGIHVPNGFSPNNDGHNDFLDIFVGNDISSFNFILYDRWGHVIFTTDSDSFLWDGTHRTKPVNTGVYAYTVEVQLNDGSSDIVNGNVTLIR